MSEFRERQEKENRRKYEKWLSCGFIGEMTTDEYGWCNNEINRSELERITIFEKGYQYRAHIEYYHLPNGKWVSGSSLTCPIHGYGSGASIWASQYDSKEEAVTAELDRIENSMEEKDRQPFVMKALEACRKKYKKLETTTATVFDIDPEFYYGKNFQQTSLFYEEPTLF